MLDPNTTATHLSVQDADSLRKTAKWARFLAIVGFVMIGLMVLAGFSMGAFLGRMASMQSEMLGTPMPFDVGAIGTMYTVIFLLVGALYFVPTLLLFQFATRTLRSLAGSFDPITFTSGLESHRRLYKFMGILMIIVLSIYALFFFFMLLFAGAMFGLAN
ncbi:MAG: hypothetical protein IPN85_02525 [Flavobacteriales bacterium]|nr:hypothetical protein [Flavobacteriales bacterium]MBK9287225.1 hypothetical protein [Flavobacteriales bacterium]MBL0034290.1 hypothetical protein [Flavobacteriales bacterium]